MTENMTYYDKHVSSHKCIFLVCIMERVKRLVGNEIELGMEIPMIESPSGKMPEKAPRWGLMGTEGCGGVKVFSWMLLVFLEYM